MNPSKGTTILIADDHEQVRKLLKQNFEKLGLQVVAAADGSEALSMLSDETCAALLDLKMPEVDGLECLHHIRKNFPNIPVILMSGEGEIEEAVDAMKSGALDYVTKPFDMDELVTIVKKAIHLGKVSRENRDLQVAMGQSKPISQFIGESPSAQKILEQIPVIAPLDSSVLITGESGVGKGLLARTIHFASPRAEGPFVSVSCPSLPRELLESEMFGHEKGAFTGALQRRIGRAEMANKGTLFLDELADLPLNLQPKLLTFLQERTFQRIGGDRILSSDVRVIAATNADLAKKVDSGEFRKDLYFRLNVFPLHVPPLKQRKEDLPQLAEQILQRISEMRSEPVCVITSEGLELMNEYNWPGNVRELE
ncbi:MAG: sigma-54 dependent transcriptional regulator, partial [Verrucomicrobiota bacterium]